jgi:hypothetical protein
VIAANNDSASLSAAPRFMANKKNFSKRSCWHRVWDRPCVLCSAMTRQCGECRDPDFLAACQTLIGPRLGPAIIFSRPARCSFVLRPALAESPTILYIDTLIASTAAAIATGCSELVRGREFHPLKSSGFHGRSFHAIEKAPDRFSWTRKVLGSKQAYSCAFCRWLGPAPELRPHGDSIPCRSFPPKPGNRS